MGHQFERLLKLEEHVAKDGIEPTPVQTLERIACQVQSASQADSVTCFPVQHAYNIQRHQWRNCADDVEHHAGFRGIQRCLWMSTNGQRRSSKP